MTDRICGAIERDPCGVIRRREEGFTLIELLLSISILAFMMMIAWSVISGTVFARRNLAVRQEREHEVRVATGVMVRDLASAYLSANEDQSLVERRTLFVGKSSNDVDDLRFSSMAHRSLWAEANESEQTVISYAAEPDPDDSHMTNLIRKEQRRPTSDQSREEPVEVDLLVRDVKRVSFEYYDFKDKEWKEHWDSTQADGERGRVPTRVRIVIAIAAPEGVVGSDDVVKYTTQARIMLQEELKFFTN